MKNFKNRLLKVSNYSRYFLINNVKKHFTISNIIVGIIGLTVGCLFKFTGLSANILSFLYLDPSIYNQYILSGVATLSVRLGSKGVVEAILPDIFAPKPLTMDKGSFLNPKPLAMDINRLLNPTTPPSNSGGGVGGGSASPNQNPGGSNPVQPQQNVQPQQDVDLIDRATRWHSLNHDGLGFRVRNGDIHVDNPFNITSYWGMDGWANRSLQAKNYARNIHRALEYHKDYTGLSSQWFPPLDDSSCNWINEFFDHKYPDRKVTRCYNSQTIRKEILRFSRINNVG